jgi:hypothetical protein
MPHDQVYVCTTSHYDQVSKVGGLEENLNGIFILGYYPTLATTEIPNGDDSATERVTSNIFGTGTLLDLKKTLR